MFEQPVKREDENMGEFAQRMRDYNQAEAEFVFCGAKQDNNLYRLYVHEVFYDDKLKTDSLQTAAVDDIVNRLHGGIGLYKSILIDALEYRGKGTTNSSTD